MNKINLTTKLNLKIIGVVLLLMITVTAHNQWLSLQGENEQNIQWLISITDFLVKKKPDGSFSDMALRQGAANLSTRQQVLAINQELQPVLQAILVPTDIIKYGFYAKQQESIVAIGPHSDISLLLGLDSNCLKYKIFETDTEQLFEKKILFCGMEQI